MTGKDAVNTWARCLSNTGLSSGVLGVFWTRTKWEQKRSNSRQMKFQSWPKAIQGDIQGPSAPKNFLLQTTLCIAWWNYKCVGVELAFAFLTSFLQMRHFTPETMEICRIWPVCRENTIKFYVLDKCSGNGTRHGRANYFENFIVFPRQRLSMGFSHFLPMK